MSTRGLLAFRFQGQDYVTYNPSDSYPKALGARIVRFAQEHLNGDEAIQAFGRKLAGLEWVARARDARSACLHGADLLTAIAGARVNRIVRDSRLFQTRMDCEFAYILDLDAGVLEFWDLPERAESFPLASISPCAVGVMECGRRT
jgi:hypothetical protein